MKKVFFLLLILLTLGGVIYVRSQNKIFKSPTPIPNSQTQNFGNDDSVQFKSIAQNLDTPWAIAFLPDKNILTTQRDGSVFLIGNDNNISEIGRLQNAKEIGEGGLLGIVVHPKFEENKFVYFYYTYSENNGNTLNRVVRMKYDLGRLTGEQTIIDKIPGASNHNGGRIKFGPDGMLYVGTGDAQEPTQAQNKNSLAGKILRVRDDGSVPSDNPFANPVYSYGHRNVQGLAWDSKNMLWATEHGRSGIQSGLDELNLIEKGKNYGWPDIEGDETRPGMESPKRNSGNTTWAPAGAAYISDLIYFGGLRGEALYVAKIQGSEVIELREHFKGQFGRIREVILGPDNLLYITTSNNDGRGSPQSGDDKILIINPAKQ